MGTSSSSNKTKRKANVQLSIRNFVIVALPSKPNEWSQKIDNKIWGDFQDKCRSSIPSDMNERRRKYNQWRCYYIPGVILFTLGCIYGLAAGLYGLLNAITVLWISAIIICILSICISSALLKKGNKLKNKRAKIYKKYIQDLSDRLDVKLNTLNERYHGMLKFTNKGYGKGNIFKNKKDPGKLVSFDIKIDILSKNIEYIPSKKRRKGSRKKSDRSDVDHGQYDDVHNDQLYHGHNEEQIIMIQQPQQIVVQPQPVPVQPQQQVIMVVQMADGSMVPAQLQQPAPQVQIRDIEQPNPEYNDTGGGFVVQMIAPSAPDGNIDSPQAPMDVDGYGNEGEGDNPTDNQHSYQ